MAVKMKQEQVSAMKQFMKKFILIIIFYHLFSPFIAFDEHMMLFLQYDFKIWRYFIDLLRNNNPLKMVELSYLKCRFRFISNQF